MRGWRTGSSPRAQGGSAEGAAAMLSAIEPVVLFVPDLAPAVQWYRIVLGSDPEFAVGRTIAFRVGRDLDLLLVAADGEHYPHSAALVCDDLESMLGVWREYAGVV